jgi:hypothetical protein
VSSSTESGVKRLSLPYGQIPYLVFSSLGKNPAKDSGERLDNIYGKTQMCDRISEIQSWRLADLWSRPQKPWTGYPVNEF